MKKLFVLMIIIFFLSSCTSTEVLPTPTMYNLPTALVFTETPVPTVTETPLPTLIPTATLAPVAVECDVDKNITEDICPFVEDAVLLGRSTLIQYFGRDISAPVKLHFSKDIATAIEITDKPHVSGGANMDKSLVVQINIESKIWRDYGAEDQLYRRVQTILHEMTHIWQAQNQCDKADVDSMLEFVSEGQAQYVALMGSNRLELFNPGQAIVMWSHMKYNENDWINSADVSQLVFKDLVDARSSKDYVKFCDLLAKGNTARDAFQAAFQISIQDFRDQFKDKTLGMLKDCTQATCGAKLGSEDPRYGTLTTMIDYSLKEPNFFLKIVDQQGKPVPKVNLQLFRRFYNNFYFGTGGEDAGTNAEGVLSAPVLPGTYAMTFCEPGWTVGHYSKHPTKCVYELHNFEVLPGETKTVEYKYWNIYDPNLPEPNFIFTLLGVDGNPVGNQYVQVCGYDAISTVCLNGKTDDIGVFKVSLMAGNYLVRLVQPGQGYMDPRGVTDPEKGMNLDPYHGTGDFEYEIRDIKIENSAVKSLSYQFPTPNLKIQFLDANGGLVPNMPFILCKSQMGSSGTAEEKAANDKMLSAYYPDWESHPIKAGDMNGDCFLGDHTDKLGVFQVHVDAGKYFIYYDNPGSFLYEFYFDHVMTDIVVGDKDVTSVSAEFK